MYSTCRSEAGEGMEGYTRSGSLVSLPQGDYLYQNTAVDERCDFDLLFTALPSASLLALLSATILPQAPSAFVHVVLPLLSAITRTPLCAANSFTHQTCAALVSLPSPYSTDCGSPK